MSVAGAIGVGVAIIASFALGAWVQDARVHKYYIQQGRMEVRNEFFDDAAMDYLGCLGAPPRCDQQERTYEWVKDHSKLFAGAKP